MFRAAVLAALIATNSISPAQANSESARTTYYAKCMVVAAQLATSDDPTTKASGGITFLFYAGHIFGADPNIDLEPLLVREAIALTKSPEESRALAVQCGSEMGKRGEQIQAAGESIQALAAGKSP